MSSCELFFGQLRQLASSVDKKSNELRATLENSENTGYNENRACLLLREILAEAKELKKDVKSQFNGIELASPYGDFVSGCEQFLTQTKQQIFDLEIHLGKYGYVKPADELPEIQCPTKPDKCQTEETSAAMEVVETTCLSSSELSLSGNCHVVKEAFDQNTASAEDTVMEEDCSVVPNEKENPEDLLKSPVPPTTFTKMLQITPQKPFGSTEGFLQEDQRTPHGTPVPPQTTTPMIKTKPGSLSLDTPQESHFPTQPVTVTPMIKLCENRPSESENTPQGLSPKFASPLLPPPPTLGTPGLKTIAPSVMGDSSPELSCCLDDNLPLPPEIVSVKLLKPDDAITPCHPTTEDQHDFIQPLQEEEYTKVPKYVTNQFNLECINHHINTINVSLLNSSQDIAEPSIQEQDLRNLLGLGPATKAFMLALAKTGRLRLSRNRIIFLKSS